MGWKNSLATSLMSPGFVSQLKSELRAMVFRVKCFSPTNLFKIWKARKNRQVRLNIGAGHHVMPDWIGIDLFKAEAGFRWDVRWGVPLPAGSCSEIHCEHFLEHLEYPFETGALLKECQRLLARNGKLRLIVPDAERYIRAYTNGDRQFWEALSDLGNASPPFETEIEIMNQAFRMGGDHRFAFDKKTVTRQLQQAGFNKIEANDCGAGADLSDTWRKIESLYLTALKC